MPTFKSVTFLPFLTENQKMYIINLLNTMNDELISVNLRRHTLSAAFTKPMTYVKNQPNYNPKKEIEYSLIHINENTSHRVPRILVKRLLKVRHLSQIPIPSYPLGIPCFLFWLEIYWSLLCLTHSRVDPCHALIIVSSLPSLLIFDMSNKFWSEKWYHLS